MKKKKCGIPSLNRMLDHHGWVITGVPGGAIYTVGVMDKFQHPELAIHGLRPDMNMRMLHATVMNVVARGSKLEPGSISNEVAEGYPTKIVAVHPSNFPDWFAQALEYEGPNLRMVQLVWPDKAGKFPGEPGLSDGVKHQKVFDVRHEDYDQVQEHWPEGHVCAKCGGE